MTASSVCADFERGKKMSESKGVTEKRSARSNSRWVAELLSERPRS